MLNYLKRNKRKVTINKLINALHIKLKSIYALLSNLICRLVLGLGRRICRRPLKPRGRDLERKGPEIGDCGSIAIRGNSLYWVPFSTGIFHCVCWLPRRLCLKFNGCGNDCNCKNSNKFIFNFSYPTKVSRAHTLHNASHETPSKSIKMKLYLKKLIAARLVFGSAHQFDHHCFNYWQFINLTASVIQLKTLQSLSFFPSLSSSHPFPLPKIFLPLCFRELSAIYFNIF